ncbi:hypothetical protein HBI88_071520 [Parastagonospora nodorum]|nr:hypothetical protein HBI97_081580 [Parastagonospora nodorum]KAH5811427.1 hypothetical protein HBI96_089030 [Parastagonospora nodorum]KAH5827352.1 hypothetical protein HBI94_061580 [Parastagonospora nodorum]KAH5837002.1 hypothetical protein HBI93_092760 [Parastagonospora nodorum]KAH5871626.1 hypothetical protein HBI91_071160 [Parastagonospora nodorum]
MFSRLISCSLCHFSFLDSSNLILLLLLAYLIVTCSYVTLSSTPNCTHQKPKKVKPTFRPTADSNAGAKRILTNLTQFVILGLPPARI